MLKAVPKAWVSPDSTIKARSLLVIVAGAVVTVLTSSSVGPATSKLEGLFGLVGWAGRIPFYLLQFYIGFFVLWIKPGKLGGLALGVLLVSPLALWSIAAKCPPVVPATYLLSGAFQGILLTWLTKRYV